MKLGMSKELRVKNLTARLTYNAVSMICCDIICFVIVIRSSILIPDDQIQIICILLYNGTAVGSLYMAMRTHEVLSVTKQA